MEVKDRIMHKSHELFNRYGIRSVSMDDIAAQLGMSKKTLYQYYEDKNELVNAVFDNVLDENKIQCISCADHGENAIHEVFLSFDMLEVMLSEMNPTLLFDMQKYHPVAFQKFQDFRNKFLYKLIRQNIERGISEGLYREEIDIDIMTRFRLHCVLLSLDSNIFPSNKTRLINIEQQLIVHFMYGISTLKGNKLIEKYRQQRIKKSER